MTSDADRPVIVAGVDGSQCSLEALRWAALQSELTAIERALGPEPRAPIVAQVVEGHPARALIEASRRAQLLVDGCRGHGGFAGMLLGSVSEHCVSHAECSVVVVRQHQP